MHYLLLCFIDVRRYVDHVLDTHDLGASLENETLIKYRRYLGELWLALFLFFFVFIVIVCAILLVKV